MNGRPRRPAYAGERDAGAVGGTRGCGGGRAVGAAGRVDAGRAGRQEEVGAGGRDVVRGAGLVAAGPGLGTGCGRRLGAVVVGGRGGTAAPGVVEGAGAGGPVGVLGGLMGAGCVRGGGRHPGGRPGCEHGSGGCGGGTDDGEDGEEECGEEQPGRTRGAGVCRGARPCPRGHIPRGRPREGGHPVSPVGAGAVPARRSTELRTRPAPRTTAVAGSSAGRTGTPRRTAIPSVMSERAAPPRSATGPCAGPRGRRRAGPASTSP